MANLDDDDLKAIKSLIEVTINEMELVTKEDLSFIPTKDEFYEETGKILKRLDDLETEKDILVHNVSNHEDRIKDLEVKVGIQAS